MKLVITDDISHLGGHLYKTHVDYGAFDYIIEHFLINSMIDVGCATAGMVDYAKTKNIEAIGLDGDKSIDPDILHDFVNGPFIPPENYDLCWSVEFLEHVEEQYMDNFFAVFEKCKYVICTHAFPEDTGGHHHVNLQLPEYWIEEFKKRGFVLDQEMTDGIRKHSTMVKGFMKKSGLFFIKETNNATI
tara:strand:+ start:2101 stop:2664 length:564 start_codon:yes stop_codon:yes gene_type:complete